MIWVILFLLAAIWLAYRWDNLWYGEADYLTFRVCIIAICITVLVSMCSCSVFNGFKEGFDVKQDKCGNKYRSHMRASTSLSH